MLVIRTFILLLSALFLAACAKTGLNCGCECCVGKEVCCCHAVDTGAGVSDAKAARHPLKGVVVERFPEKSALLVKHEEIPGVMRAMTMFFQVDAATLGRIKKGDVISATMFRQGDDWRLEDVKIK